MHKFDRKASCMVRFSQNYSSGHGIKETILVIMFAFLLELLALQTLEFHSNPCAQCFTSPQAGVLALGQQVPNLPRTPLSWPTSTPVLDC